VEEKMSSETPAFVTLDFGDDGVPLRLRYTIDSLDQLADELGFELNVHDLLPVRQHLTTKNMPVYLWGGRLWEDPKAKIEVFRERLRSAVNLDLMSATDTIHRSLNLGFFGTELPPGAKEEPPTPPQSPGPSKTSNGGAGESAASSRRRSGGRPSPS
jgi:hypothetical protein